jgi:hypothetical protein
MKKNTTKNQKPHRLRLNRETIQILQDPALLELAGGASDWCTGFSEGGLGCHTVTGSGDTC